MKIEEAIKLLDDITSYCDFTDEYGDMIDSEPYYEALDLAIKALDLKAKVLERKTELYYKEGVTEAEKSEYYALIKLLGVEL